jgi:predicted ATPase
MDIFLAVGESKIPPDGEEELVEPENKTMNGIALLLDFMDRVIARFMYGVTYLGPQRAVADRAYRLEEVAIEEVNAKANNLPNFLVSLSEAEMRSFAAFTRQYLGFETTVHIEGVHVEILIKEAESSVFINIADVGFGYAEVLPLCALLWSSCIREPSLKRRETSLLAIEQPELHLHPFHQAKLAGVIVGAWRASRDAGREVKIMVETHSEGIVNWLGDLIEEGSIKASDVQILFFDQDPETRQTEVRLTGYTKDGALDEGWPFGFFAPFVD